MGAADTGWANRWGGAPIVADPAGAFGVGYVSAALVDLVGRGVLTAPQSKPNESFVFKRLKGATPNRSYNRFSQTPQPRTAAPLPLKHRSTDPPHAPEVGLPSSRSFDPSTAAKECFRAFRPFRRRKLARPAAPF